MSIASPRPCSMDREIIVKQAKGGINKIRSKYSFRCLLSSYFIILVVTSPPSSSSNITGSSRFPKREEERRGRVTLFPISLTSLERAPPLAPPCPIIPVNHVDKEGTITTKYSILRGKEILRVSFPRCNRRASVNVDRPDWTRWKLQNYVSTPLFKLFDVGRKSSRVEVRDSCRDRAHR